MHKRTLLLKLYYYRIITYYVKDFTTNKCSIESNVAFIERIFSKFKFMKKLFVQQLAEIYVSLLVLFIESSRAYKIYSNLVQNFVNVKIFLYLVPGIVGTYIYHLYTCMWL